MRYLVTGCYGFVGAYLVRHVASVEPDAAIVAIDRRAAPAGFPKVNGSYELDLLDATALAQVIEREQPDRLVHLASFTSYLGRGRLTIGDFVSISSGARLYTGIDDFSGGSLVGPGVPEPYRQPTRTFLTVEKFALVGANAVVFPGVTLGEGCAVGALSLVDKDCEPWTIYGGVPARPLKARRKDRILELEARLREDLYDAAGKYVPRARR